MTTTGWIILIVEDEPDSAQVIAQLLEHHGIAIRLAHNGEECLAWLRQITPTVILMDLSMPIKDGWQTLHEIRQDSAYAAIPIVAVTAFDTPFVADQAQEAGFDAFYSKPVNVFSFIQDLERIVAASSAG